MNKHLMLYQNHSQYVNPTVTPNVSYCVNENHVHYQKEHDYSRDYLTFVNKRNWNGGEANMSFTPVFDEIGDIAARNILNISYSTDNGNTWVDFKNMIDWSQIPVGGKVLFKGSNLITTDWGFGGFDGEFDGDVEGNIMSLFYGDDFVDKTSFFEYYNNDSIYLKELFSNISIKSAKNLILPVTTLTNSCYADMFYGCTSLTIAPKLPATTLADYCYRDMFSGCTSLTVAPNLPATILAYSCYLNMFKYCTSLTTAPILSATTLKERCYSCMFEGCTSLTIMPELPATTLKTSCYYAMFAECTNLTTLSELPATTLEPDCYSEMFRNCTNITLEAIVPNSVTPVRETCCNGMYYGCSITTPSGQYSSIAYLEYEEMP